MLILNQHGDVLHDLPDGTRSFTGLNLRGAQMAGLNLEGVWFDETDLTGANFAGADLYCAKFYDTICDDCDFSGASLRGVDLFRSSFIGANFRGADFSNDNLDGGTDLKELDLSTVQLEGALYTDSTHARYTIFPDGFDPLAHGMKPYNGPEVH